MHNRARPSQGRFGGIRGWGLHWGAASSPGEAAGASAHPQTSLKTPPCRAQASLTPEGQSPTPWHASPRRLASPGVTHHRDTPPYPGIPYPRETAKLWYQLVQRDPQLRASLTPERPPRPGVTCPRQTPKPWHLSSPGTALPSPSWFTTYPRDTPSSGHPSPHRDPHVLEFTHPGQTPESRHCPPQRDPPLRPPLRAERPPLYPGTTHPPASRYRSPRTDLQVLSPLPPADPPSPPLSRRPPARLRRPLPARRVPSVPSVPVGGAHPGDDGSVPRGHQQRQQRQQQEPRRRAAQAPHGAVPRPLRSPRAQRGAAEPGAAAAPAVIKPGAAGGGSVSHPRPGSAAAADRCAHPTAPRCAAAARAFAAAGAAAGGWLGGSPRRWGASHGSPGNVPGLVGGASSECRGQRPAGLGRTSPSTLKTSQSRSRGTSQGWLGDIPQQVWGMSHRRPGGTSHSMLGTSHSRYGGCPTGGLGQTFYSIGGNIPQWVWGTFCSRSTAASHSRSGGSTQQVQRDPAAGGGDPRAHPTVAQRQPIAAGASLEAGLGSSAHVPSACAPQAPWPAAAPNSSASPSLDVAPTLLYEEELPAAPNPASAEP